MSNNLKLVVDLWWNEKVYHGFGRYDDLAKNLLLHKCLVVKTEGCFEGGSGPLDSIIKFMVILNQFHCMLVL